MAAVSRCTIFTSRVNPTIPVQARLILSKTLIHFHSPPTYGITSVLSYKGLPLDRYYMNAYSYCSASPSSAHRPPCGKYTLIFPSPPQDVLRYDGIVSDTAPFLILYPVAIFLLSPSFFSQFFPLVPNSICMSEGCPALSFCPKFGAG